jgi:acyl carrier protein
MTVTQTEADIVRIVRLTFTDAADAVITAETGFADLGLDSLTRIDVLAAAEAHFGIEVPDEVVGTLLTVQDLMDFVEKAVIG